MPEGRPAHKDEYRLVLLDLPQEVVKMIHSLETPPPENRQVLVNALRGYESALRAIQAALDLEGPTDSHMAKGLRHVEAIALHRVMACESVFAAWRKLPVELWDKIFASYLDGFVGRVKGGRGMKMTPDVRPKYVYGYGLYKPPSPSVEQDVWTDFSAMNAPYSLMRVCQAWRTAVFSTKSTWTCVAIAPVERETTIGKLPFVTSAAAGHLFSRLRRLAANPSPWSLSIMQSGTGAVPHTDLPLSSVFTMVEAPWRTIDRLKLDMDLSITPYPGQPPHVSTTSLVIFSRKIAEPGRIKSPPQVPKLKKAVLLNAVDLMSDEITTNIPWSQLTHLLIGSKLSGKHIHGLLRLCSSLRHASFFIDDDLVSPNSPAWSYSQPDQLITLHALEILDIIAPKAHRHFTVPLADIAFPSVRRLRIFGDYYDPLKVNGYLSPFHSLTHLSLVVTRASLSTTVVYYDIGVILDACPLLVELVASLEENLNSFIESLVFEDEKPRGQQLRAVVLLCDLREHIGALPVYIGAIPIQLGPRHNPFQSTFQIIKNFVASRRKPDVELRVPALLDRFIIRFTDTSLSGVGIDEPVLYSNLQNAIATALRPFVEDGLQLSVEATYMQLNSFIPSPSAKHWDEGAMDFLDDYWEYTTAMPASGR